MPTSATKILPFHRLYDERLLLLKLPADFKQFETRIGTPTAKQIVMDMAIVQQCKNSVAVYMRTTVSAPLLPCSSEATDERKLQFHHKVCLMVDLDHICNQFTFMSL